MMSISFKKINKGVNDELDTEIAKLKYDVTQGHKSLQEFMRKLKVIIFLI
jgi:hypothetical protein